MGGTLHITDLVEHVSELHPDADALTHLADAVTVGEQLGVLADDLVQHFVRAARDEGATWAEIGASMGVTRQAVQKRFMPKLAGFTPLDPALLAGSTPSARAVVAAAEQEARAAGHNYVGTEHLVLALFAQPEGLAAKALAQKVTPEQVRTAMNEVLGPPADGIPDEIPFTPRGRKAIELSVQEAQRLGHDSVGTEHILLGVLVEKLGIGAQVLLRLGVDPQGVEEWLRSGDSV